MPLAANALTTYATVKSELGLTDDNAQAALERQINAASAALESMCQRKFYFEAGIVENVPGQGGYHLRVSRWPLKSISAVNLLNPDQTISYTYDPATYSIDKRGAGLIYRNWGAYGLNASYPVGALNAWGMQTGWPNLGQPGDDIRGTPQPETERPALQVVYDGGWVTPQQDIGVDGVTPRGFRDLPFDIEQACLLTVVSLFTRMGKSRDIIAESVATGASTTYRSLSANYAPSGFVPPEAAQMMRSYQAVY